MNSSNRPKQQNPTSTAKPSEAKKAATTTPAASTSSSGTTASTNAVAVPPSAPLETVFHNLAVAEKPVEAEVDKEKKLKALRKKLRDIVEIEKKPSESLTPEQREKLGRKAAVEADIAELEKSA